ncbi:hypothetical protein Ahia01_001101300, partial [Argonauta hians]
TCTSDTMKTAKVPPAPFFNSRKRLRQAVIADPNENFQDEDDSWMEAFAGTEGSVGGGGSRGGGGGGGNNFMNNNNNNSNNNATTTTRNSGGQGRNTAFPHSSSSSSSSSNVSANYNQTRNTFTAHHHQPTTTNTTTTTNTMAMTGHSKTSFDNQNRGNKLPGAPPKRGGPYQQQHYNNNNNNSNYNNYNNNNNNNNNYNNNNAAMMNRRPMQHPPLPPPPPQTMTSPPSYNRNYSPRPQPSSSRSSSHNYNNNNNNNNNNSNTWSFSGPASNINKPVGSTPPRFGGESFLQEVSPGVPPTFNQHQTGSYGAKHSPNYHQTHSRSKINMNTGDAAAAAVDKKPVKPFQREVAPICPILTTFIKDLKFNHLNYKAKLQMMFEVYGMLDSAISPDRDLSGRQFLLRDNTDAIDCVYYEIDQTLPRMTRGRWLRCIGKVDHKSSRLHCVSIRPATGEERHLPEIMAPLQFKYLNTFTINIDD